MSIWGKIIGGTAGFALGGPIGAILGIMVGGSAPCPGMNRHPNRPIDVKPRQDESFR